jgi:hypothetical protein
MFGAKIQKFNHVTEFVTDLSPSKRDKQPTFVCRKEEREETRRRMAEKRPNCKEERTVSLRFYDTILEISRFHLCG